MNLRIFFDPILDAAIQEKYDHNAWIQSVNINNGNFPSWKDAQIALIGLTEERGTLNKGAIQGPNIIRKSLYKLSKGSSSHIKIVDLGNLRNGHSLEESQHRLKEVMEIILQNGIFPILIGGGHDMTYGQFLGYEFLEKTVNLLNIDAYLDLHPSIEYGFNKHHLQQILNHHPERLFNYAHLGYQTYLVDEQVIQRLEKLHFEMYRLGKIKENLQEIEPVIRNADILSFDITAIKSTDAPGNIYAVPFGLSSEEACQLCWFAGLSPKLSSAGFFEYNPAEDNKEQTAFVIATMIWYLIEGLATKNNTEIPASNFIKYIVAMPQKPYELGFYKDPLTEKWWMEIPYPDDVMSEEKQNTIVPCSYADFLTANNGELPFRWITTYAKLK